MKRLYMIIGETGAGKDTVTDLLCEKTGFRKVVSYTDKPIRTDQVDGVHHYFLSPEEFTKKKDHSDILGYTKIGEHRYMATMDQIDDKTKFYIIDPKGAVEMERLYGDQTDLIKIYIHVPEELRRIRTRNRGCYNFDERMRDEKKQFDEFNENGLWDLRVENIDLDKTVNTVFNAVEHIESAFARHEKEIRAIKYVQRYRKMLQKYFSAKSAEDRIAWDNRLKEAEYVLETFGICSRDEIKAAYDQEYRKAYRR